MGPSGQFSATGKTFVSYARADKGFVLKLASELDAVGIDVWVDVRDIPKGARWDDALEAALHECSQFLLVLSPASVASQNVKDEIGLVLGRGIPVVPVMYQDCKVPLRVQRFQHVDLTANYETGLRELIAALGGVASRPQLPRTKEHRPVSSGTATATSQARGGAEFLAVLRQHPWWFIVALATAAVTAWGMYRLTLNRTFESAQPATATLSTAASAASSVMPIGTTEPASSAQAAASPPTLSAPLPAATSAAAPVIPTTAKPASSAPIAANRPPSYAFYVFVGAFDRDVEAVRAKNYLPRFAVPNAVVVTNQTSRIKGAYELLVGPYETKALAESALMGIQERAARNDEARVVREAMSSDGLSVRALR